MKLAYLILAHNIPRQLNRLIETLSCPGVDFYVHVDKKVPIGQFEQTENAPHVFFIKKRIRVYWGSYNMVKATLRGFEAIMESGIDYDYIVLLSGQDYPLKSNEEILSFYKMHPGKAFMEYYSIEKVWREAILRIKEYHLTNFPFKGNTRLAGFLNKLLPERKLYGNYEIVGRSQWFSITLDHVRYILEFMRTHPRFRRYFLFCWGSDEFIFQTILYNSGFKDQMVNDDLRYTDWSAQKASPKILTLEDRERLLGSEKLFARKFDMNVDPGILDLLDAKVRNHRNLVNSKIS